MKGATPLALHADFMALAVAESVPLGSVHSTDCGASLASINCNAGRACFSDSQVEAVVVTCSAVRAAAPESR